jgi:hypothetical protein
VYSCREEGLAVASWTGCNDSAWFEDFDFSAGEFGDTFIVLNTKAPHTIHVEDECAMMRWTAGGGHACRWLFPFPNPDPFIKESEPNLEFAKSMSNRTRTAACDP